MAEPHEAAKWRVEDDRDDAPVREPMNGKGTAPAQRKKPDADQKKVRREMARSASHPNGSSRTYDICGNCGESIHDASGIDPNVPWVHADSGNSKCDVNQPADAVMLQGIDTDEAHPMYKSSAYTAQDFRDTVIAHFEAAQAAGTTQMSPGAQHVDQTHTRTIEEDDEFDPYLVTGCGDHGVKCVGDRRSQEHYIGLAKLDHNHRWGGEGGHNSTWHDDGSDCWSCCKDMRVAQPGERTSGRIAMRKGAPFAGYEDFAACVRQNQDKDDPEAYCGSIKHKVEGASQYGLPTLDEAGHRECEACGQVGAPVLGDTGPTCARCGSYSLKRAPHKQPANATYSAKQATRMDSNVATSDGRILINAGDQIKTPTGQALTVKNIRRHETSRDHYYVDTDAGTTLVPWTTNFTLVPSNQSQQFVPGTGTPGGNFSGIPGLENEVSTSAPNVCPGCGGKGTMNRQGQTYKCSRCGYSDKNVGLQQQFSDASQQFVSSITRTASGAIAQRALQVLAQEEENPL